MDLKSGDLFWPKPERRVAEWAALEEDISCDVAIIGGGVTGALVAWHLAEAGVDAVVLDRRRVAAGSTSASTSLLLYELDVSLHELIEMRGEADAVKAWRMCRTAVSRVASIVRELGDDCGFDWRPSLYLASSDERFPALRRRDG